MTHLIIQVSELGDRVWLHAPDGSTVGRFSKQFGIDVHRTATAQMRGEPECLFCTHAPAGAAEWETFRAAILQHYNFEVPADTLTFM